MTQSSRTQVPHHERAAARRAETGADPSPPDASRRRLLGLSLALPLALLGGPAQAQVGRRYQFDVVVFRHQTSEADIILEDNGRSQRLSDDAAFIGEGQTRRSNRGNSLTAAAQRLESSGEARVLAELSWEQVARTFQDAPWIRVEGGRALDRAPQPLERSGFDDFGRGNRSEVRGGAGGLTFVERGAQRHELEGRLRVWTGRYLHLETDLVVHGLDSTLDRMRAIPIQRSQRMESGSQVFYLDHPVIGCLARATRL